MSSQAITKVKMKRTNELIYAESLINDKTACAGVDSGATHCFINELKASRLGVTLEDDVD